MFWWVKRQFLVYLHGLTSTESILSYIIIIIKVIRFFGELNDTSLHVLSFNLSLRFLRPSVSLSWKDFLWLFRTQKITQISMELLSIMLFINLFLILQDYQLYIESKLPMDHTSEEKINLFSLNAFQTCDILWIIKQSATSQATMLHTSFSEGIWYCFGI